MIDHQEIKLSVTMSAENSQTYLENRESPRKVEQPYPDCSEK